MPSLTTFKLLKQEHNARRGEFKTVHGTVQTPAFQNVATAGAIKGGLSAQDLQQIGTADDISGAIWGCMGYTVLLCFCLFKTGSISKAVFTAH